MTVQGPPKRYTNAQSGDILLICSHSVTKSWNLLAQSSLRGRTASYSHVAIALDTKSAIHSMPGGGVQTAPLASLLHQDSTLWFDVFRHNDVANDSDKQTRLRESLIHFLEQPYNKWFFARFRERSSFCSELAAKAYARIGLPLSHRSPRFVLPIDLEELEHRLGWTKVTVEYHYTLRDLLSFDPIFHDAIEQAEKLDDIFEDLAQGQLELEKMERDLVLKLEAPTSVREVVRRRLSSTVSNPDLPKYWDSRQAATKLRRPKAKRHGNRNKGEA